MTAKEAIGVRLWERLAQVKNLLAIARDWGLPAAPAEHLIVRRPHS